MSTKEIYSIPKENLYWTKIKISDSISELEHKFKRVSNPKLKDEIKKQAFDFIYIMFQIERRMETLKI